MQIGINKHYYTISNKSYLIKQTYRILTKIYINGKLTHQFLL